MSDIRWHFVGGIRTVTGSCHMLEVNGEKLLIDCGLFQGRRKEASERNRNLPFDPTAVTRTIVGHAHIDHCGNLPTLVKHGYQGTIYSTHATRDLATLMLRDSAHIQARDAEYVNRRERRHGPDMVEPLYDDDDVDAALALFSSRGYGKPFYPLPGVRVTLQPAGHILGAALTLLEIEASGRTIRVGYVVDLGRANRPILKDPVQFTDLDVLIIESTYGNREHEDSEEAEARLARMISDTCERGGKILIPAFALGRTQHLVQAISRLCQEKRIPDLPVFVDSPLAVNITGVFQTHPEEFDKQTYRDLVSGGDPLGCKKVTYIQSVDASKRLNTRTDPCIIISSSGMCEAGRILHHLRNNIEDPRNTVAIVGYQAPHTLGHRLVERQNEIRIFGEPFRRRAQVEVLNAYSAHAGRSDLLQYIERAGKKLRAIYLVHGAPEQQEALHEALKERGYVNAHRPEAGSSVDLR